MRSNFNPAVQTFKARVEHKREKGRKTIFTHFPTVNLQNQWIFTVSTHERLNHEELGFKAQVLHSIFQSGREEN